MTTPREDLHDKVCDILTRFADYANDLMRYQEALFRAADEVIDCVEASHYARPQFWIAGNGPRDVWPAPRSLKCPEEMPKDGQRVLLMTEDGVMFVETWVGWTAKPCVCWWPCPPEPAKPGVLARLKSYMKTARSE